MRGQPWRRSFYEVMTFFMNFFRQMCMKFNEILLNFMKSFMKDSINEFHEFGFDRELCSIFGQHFRVNESKQFLQLKSVAERKWIGLAIA
jgi:hypothetical protein